MLRSLLSRYSALVQGSTVKAVITKSVSAGLIAAIGDCFCQCVIERHSEKNICNMNKRREYDTNLCYNHKQRSSSFNFRRLVAMMSIGTFFVGPSIHFWYHALHTFKFFPRSLLGRVAVDQLIFAPTLLPVFFITTHTLENRLHDLRSSLKKNYLSTLMLGWRIWPIAQLINFGLVPLHFRVLFGNCIGLGWNAYLDWMIHNKK